MREFEFSGQLTKNDYRRITALLTRKLWIISGAFFSIVVIYNFWKGGFQQFLYFSFGTFLLWLPWILLFPVVFVSQRIILRRYWGSNKMIQQPFEGSVTEEGINWKINGLSSSFVPWKFCLGYRESTGIFLVYIGINQVYYFFPRYFTDESQWKEFRKLVSEKLPKK